MKSKVHALDYENPEFYKIYDILERVDRDYLEFIFQKTDDMMGQKTLMGNSYSRDKGKARTNLANADNFHYRFDSLSKEAKRFYLALYSKGRVWRSREFSDNTSKFKFKPEVRECLDKLVVFGIPSRDNPEIFIIPLEYAIADNSGQSRRDVFSLIDALKSYPVTLVSKIAKEYNLKTNDSKGEVTTETYITIMKNLQRTLENLSPTEKKIMDYVMKYDGILILEDILDHFNIRNKSPYYNSISFNNLFSSSSYSGGEQFISLMKKGIIFCSKRMYSSRIDTVYMPDEVILKLWEIQHKKIEPPESKQKESESLHSILKNYEVNFAAEIKAILITIYYLESRSKKRSAESISKFLSMPVEDTDLVLSLSKTEGWLKGGISNLSLTPEGFKFIEGEKFPSRLKKHIFEEHIFSAWKAVEGQGRIFLDELRLLFLDAIYQMKYPEKLEDLTDRIKSGDTYFMLSRSLRIALLDDYLYSNNSGSISFTKNDLDNEISLWMLELVNFLKIYGLVRMSSPVTAAAVYIFPEKEFKEIYEREGNASYDNQEKTDPKPIKVLPNNDILIGTEADFTDLKKVADFSELVSADLVCTFKITKASLSTYLNKSGIITGVIFFLKKKSSVPVPETVLRLINDMEKKVDEILITKCQAVLQVNDRTVIDGIMRITGIADMIEKRISPEILAIKEGVSLYKFVTELRKKGYIVPIKVEKEKNRRRTTWYRW
ncbi:MAG: helicase-associated domain-containing protein [Candidatus Thermoplasmatota archaeon]|nr:helicase-associated domain-containing protein [Candidatus Thermoplasmatota archaeon]